MNTDKTLGDKLVYINRETEKYTIRQRTECEDVDRSMIESFGLDLTLGAN